MFLSPAPPPSSLISCCREKEGRPYLSTLRQVRGGKRARENFRMQLESLIRGLPFATSGGLLWPSGVSLPADARAWLCGALITPARGGIV